MPKAAEVRRILNKSLGAWMKANNFHAKASSFWYKPFGVWFAVVYVRLSKWGFNAMVGSEFHLNAQYGKKLSDEAPRDGDFVVPSSVCSRKQLSDWHAQKKAVLKNILKQPDLGVFCEWQRDVLESDRDEAYIAGSVASMPYLHAEDVHRWGELLVEVMPALEAELARRITATGKTRKRK